MSTSWTADMKIKRSEQAASFPFQRKKRAVAVTGKLLSVGRAGRPVLPPTVIDYLFHLDTERGSWLSDCLAVTGGAERNRSIFRRLPIATSPTN